MNAVTSFWTSFYNVTREHLHYAHYVIFSYWWQFCLQFLLFLLLTDIQKKWPQMAFQIWPLKVFYLLRNLNFSFISPIFNFCHYFNEDFSQRSALISFLCETSAKAEFFCLTWLRFQYSRSKFLPCLPQPTSECHSCNSCIQATSSRNQWRHLLHHMFPVWSRMRQREHQDVSNSAFHDQSLLHGWSNKKQSILRNQAISASSRNYQHTYNSPWNNGLSWFKSYLIETFRYSIVMWR